MAQEQRVQGTSGDRARGPGEVNAPRPASPAFPRQLPWIYIVSSGRNGREEIRRLQEELQFRQEWQER